MADENSAQLGLMFTAPAFAARQIWNVRELVSAVRTAVEREYTDVYVEGEISNLWPAQSGHLYFTLKDGDAQMKVVMFRAQARLLRFKPANGMLVIARGRVTIYEARGELQLSAEYLEPKGAGALQVAFDQLKAQLAAEGIFDAARKKPLPKMPMRIGVVTSPRGAALQDILNILRRRHHSVNVFIYPAQVQGDSAAAEVAAGVRYFNQMGELGGKNIEVIIVARGGGSAEDLAAFNDEVLARTIAASAIPVISAVGHETDFTIADFVADLRAPTPSAAAEMVIEAKQDIEERVQGLHARLGRATRYRLAMKDKRLTELAKNAAFTNMRDLLGRRAQRVDELVFRAAAAERELLRAYGRRVDVVASRVRAQEMRRLLAGMGRELQAAVLRLRAAETAALVACRTRLERAAERLKALSPEAILERGYALVFDAKGALVKDAASLSPGETVRTKLARGEFRSKVESGKLESSM